LCGNNIEKRAFFSLQQFHKEISQLKEKINLYEADLQAAKKTGDKEEVKGLNEEVNGVDEIC
jgi:hypothetical protein